MVHSMTNKLSRRERQIMDIIFELSEASAKEVLHKLPDPPSYSAMRAMLNKLEKKGFIAHKERDLKYIYYSTVNHEDARDGAINRLVKTFFAGSASQAMTTLLDITKEDVSDEELDELNKLIEQARRARRN